jgi:hypothetical protein
LRDADASACWGSNAKGSRCSEASKYRRQHPGQRSYDRVYIEKKNKTPDEIKNAVYEACQKSLAKPSQKGNCDVMAQMAKNLADLRNAGVSLVAVEDRLRKDGLSPEELSLGLTVARLVYKTSGTGQELKDAIRRKCK